MRRLAALVTIALVALLPSSQTPARHPASLPGKPGLDVRFPADPKDRGGLVLREPTVAQRALADALAAELPGLTLRWDGVSASPKWIAAPAARSLSSPSTADPEEIARQFLRSRAALFGLAPREVDRLRVSSVVPGRAGGWHVYLIQTAAGLELFDGRANVNIRPDGSVGSVGSRLYAGVDVRATAVLGPGEAVRLAAAEVYPGIPFSESVLSSEDGGERLTVFDRDGFGFDPRTRLILFPEADRVRLAWEVRVAEPTLYTSYRMVLDAIDGELLYRENTTLYAEARYLNANAPDPLTEEFEPAQFVLATIPASTPESPSGWISGAGTSLEGNNATSHLGFRDDPGLSDSAGIYDYPYNTPRAGLVNAWWWVNDAHDRFYALGFDEEAGNAQQDNFGNPGLGGDPVKVTAYVAGWRNEAWFSRTVDGTASHVSVTWTDCRFCGDHDGLADMPVDGTTGDRNTANERDTIYHEYTHLVTTRMVGGPAEDGWLTGVQSEAMGEGWSDVLTASLFGIPTLWKHSYEGTGLARDMRHDLTYDHLCQIDLRNGCQQHQDGMIWAGTLWDLRQSMIALDPAQGLDRFHRIVVEGLKYFSVAPTMVDGREGILEADRDLYGSVHHQVIWNVFAARGMGNNASSASENDTTPTTDYTVPAAHTCSAPSIPTSVSAAAEGDNAIRLSYDATGAQAVEIWREDLDAPWDRPVRIGATDDLATFLDAGLQGSKSYRYHLVALGGGGIVCRSDPSATADATATGACDAWPVLDPGLTVTDGDPGCRVSLSWNPATQGCPGSGDPIVYSVYRAPSPGFEPSDRLLIARTTSTTLQDVPSEAEEYPFWLVTDNTPYYLVLAEHATVSDDPDHRDRGISQILRWVPTVPTLGRTPVQSWDFESGPQGWTVDNTDDPAGGWVVTDPSPTFYAGRLLAPDEAAGGSGQAWVTGDAGGPSDVAAHDSRGQVYLTSPVWDATGGATILSYDYWTFVHGNFWAGLDLRIDNGTDRVQVPMTGMATVQGFETAGRHGWQRAEIDLARWLAPTATMSVTFVTHGGWPFGEFGIDNVRVESGTTCARSGLTLDAVTVDDTPPGWGNGNGVLEPGETARLDVRLVNDGSVTAFSPVGRVASPLPGMLVHEATSDFPDIPPAATGSSVGPGFTVTLPVARECSEAAVFDFEFTDAAGTTSYANWNPEFGHVVTETVFEDDFETDKGWTPGGFSGRGIWQRGDPIGTTDGANQANPEDDSPNDAGAQCYVTENSSLSDPNAADVDAVGSGQLIQFPSLGSPEFDLSGYKRARLIYDLWLYDNSTGDPPQDHMRNVVHVNSGGTLQDQSWTPSHIDDPTNGWVTVTRDLTHDVPMTSRIRAHFVGRDYDPDHIVEVGVDNVRVEGDLQVCDPLGVLNPPNGVGDTVRVNKNGTDAEIVWTASPVDATHDGAAYYEVWVSAMPDGGFGVDDTTTEIRSARPLAGPTEFYKLAAVNNAGTSGDEPTP